MIAADFGCKIPDLLDLVVLAKATEEPFKIQPLVGTVFERTIVEVETINVHYRTPCLWLGSLDLWHGVLMQIIEASAKKEPVI